MLERDPLTGPLHKLTPVFVDVETYVDRDTTLQKQTLRQYLASSYMTAIAIAVGRDEPEVFDAATPEFEAAIELLRQLAQSDTAVFVAHNAAFDIRVLRFKCDVAQPKHVWCTLEGAMGAWPELPGGYGLSNCCERLKFPADKRKFELKLDQLTTARNQAERKGKVLTGTLPDWFQSQLEAVLKSIGKPMPPQFAAEDFDEILLVYNKRDVAAMQELYYRQIELLPPVEQQIALLTNNIRRFHFEVNNSRLEELISSLNDAIKQSEDAATDYLTDDADISQIFNRETDDGSLRSIRYTRLRSIIQHKLGAKELESASLKKLSPVKLARYPSVHRLLEQTANAGKMVFHRRRAEMFRSVDVVDAELGYMRAHTGRFSSPSVGKGLNLHNLPKHLKAVAKPVRKLFRVPDEYCLVRADLANVEYRVEGILTGCKTVVKMFEDNQLADPYTGAWRAMTSIKIDKGTESGKAMRQVAKSAVLGLGFAMSAPGYANVLLKAIAMGEVTEQKLREVAANLGWRMPETGLDDILTKTGCSITVALAAYHIHKSFHQAHYEFFIVADWLVRCVQIVASAGDYDYAARALERAHAHSAAPDPNMIHLTVEPDRGCFKHPSVRAQCGPWVETVCWREPLMRRVMFDGNLSEPRLTIRKASGMFKAFTRQLAIENITQAAARNQLCHALLRLEKLGWPDVLHVHDEVMLIVPKRRDLVLKARDALLSVLGPDAKDKPLKWATLVKPEEISCTQSLWEEESDIAEFIEDKNTKERLPGGDRWGKILRDEPDCLSNLP